MFQASPEATTIYFYKMQHPLMQQKYVPLNVTAGHWRIVSIRHTNTIHHANRHTHTHFSQSQILHHCSFRANPHLAQNPHIILINVIKHVNDIYLHSDRRHILETLASWMLVLCQLYAGEMTEMQKPTAYWKVNVLLTSVPKNMLRYTYPDTLMASEDQ